MKTLSLPISSRSRLQTFSYAIALPLALFFVLAGVGARTALAVTNIVWSDEFNGSSPNVDTNKWTFDIGNNGGWGNAEREFYTSRTNNAYVAGGVLHIVGRAELTNSGGTTYRYTSARLKTYNNQATNLFSKTRGVIEFRTKLPHGFGFWPANWTLGTNIFSQAWPRCGELDIMENKGSNFFNVGGTIHYNTSGNPGGDVFQSKNFSVPSAVTNFHTYAVQWTTNSINWLVDNVSVQLWTNWTSSLGAFPAPFDRPQFLLMNLAIGGNFLTDGGDSGTDTNFINAHTTFPGEMQIDYVRVYDDVPPLKAIGLHPVNGCLAGGTPITINGSNFFSGVTVTIGGVPATSVVVVNSNTITAVTPANPAGPQTVAVSGPYVDPTGTNVFTSTLTNAFTYTPGPSFAGLANITAAIEGATLTWSAASGSAPLSYSVFEATSSGAENFGSPTTSTGGLSTFIAPLYPGSNSPITYFFVVRATDSCGNSDGNTMELSIQPLLDPNKSQVGDGIFNGWKQQYGFNAFDPGVAAADPDGDGVANLQEFLAGTDPTNSASYFHVISIASQGDDILITWMCGGGRTNVVQAAFDLNSGYSSVSPNIVLSGTGDSVTNYLDTGAGTNSPYFYRIQFVP